MTARVRFAPSPTGLLHVGNARVALINWLFARRQGGFFLLRLDDTDLERSRPEYADAIRRDLEWLGLGWDQLAAQSQRLDRYDEAARRLKEMGRLYACFETPEELEYKRKRQLARGQPPVYDRAGLTLTAAQRAQYEAEGRQPHWRFLLDHQDVRWTDLVRGACHYHGANISDPVLIRADGSYLYTLPSVVDDVDFAITHIVRGEDHVTNSAPQIQLFQALGATPPGFAHLSLMVGADGQGLSKRLGSLSLGELRQDGLEPMAVNALLAKLGSSDPVEVRHSLAQLVAEFDFAKFGRAAPRFDPAELAHLNARLLHETPFAAVADRLDGVDEALWLAVRGNLARLSDVARWRQVVHGDIAPVIEDAAFCAQAAALLPPEPWDEDSWGVWTSAVKQATGAKGKMLFHPLRLALTAAENGPELKKLLPLIGRSKVIARLQGRGENRGA